MAAVEKKRILAVDDDASICEFYETTLDMPILACGGCGSFSVTLLTGEEFLIVSMQVAEA